MTSERIAHAIVTMQRELIANQFLGIQYDRQGWGSVSDFAKGQLNGTRKALSEALANLLDLEPSEVWSLAQAHAQGQYSLLRAGEDVPEVTEAWTFDDFLALGDDDEIAYDGREIKGLE